MGTLSGSIQLLAELVLTESSPRALLIVLQLSHRDSKFIDVTSSSIFLINYCYSCFNIFLLRLEFLCCLRYSSVKVSMQFDDCQLNVNKLKLGRVGERFAPLHASDTNENNSKTYSYILPTQNTTQFKTKCFRN